jgi:hypothetical protein
MLCTMFFSCDDPVLFLVGASLALVLICCCVIGAMRMLKRLFKGE